jgi:ferredoxin-NADP reductase
MNEYFRWRVSSVKKETLDCSSLTLVPESIFPFTHEAGQFLNLVFPRNGGEDRRSYSISSAPLAGEPLTITVKRIPNGEYSRKILDHTRPGSEFFSTAAAGFFVLPQDPKAYAQYFFMAAGSGITPVLPLIRTLLILHPRVHILLIYSNHTPETTIFHAELSALQKSYPSNLNIEWLFSNNLLLERARLSKWLLARMLDQYLLVPPRDLFCYTCGPFDYMRMVAIALKEAGVPPHHIKRETFYVQAPALQPVPPDIGDQEVELSIAAEKYRFTCRYPESILQASRKVGIRIPYSCEAGRCGTCVARCLDGQVWMRYNEVLLQEDLDRGLILTCVGFPVGGSVKLEL